MHTGQQPTSEELMMSPSAVVKEFEKSIGQHTDVLNHMKNEKAILDARIEDMRAQSVDLSRRMDEMRGVIEAETAWRDIILKAVRTQSPGGNSSSNGETNG